MPPNTADYVLSHGFIQQAGTFGERKAILVNVSQQEDKAGGSIEQEFYGTAGFYVWPDPPDDNGVGCEAKSIKEDDDDPVIATRDLRLSARVTPAEGDVGVCQYGGGYLTFRWDDDHRGSVVVLSSTRLDDQLEQVEEAHALLMDPSSGNSSIQLLHALGSGLVFNKDGDVYLSNADGSARLTIYEDGSVALKCDNGLKVSGAVVIGDVTQAREVPLHQQVADFCQNVIIALTALSTQVKSAPLFAAGVDAQVAQLVADLAALNGIGKAQTLKASPV